MNTIQLLTTLVKIPSPFPAEKEIGLYLMQYLDRLGFHVSKVKTSSSRFNIVATYGSAKNYLGFYGHMDTVPADMEVTAPFSMKIKGKVARGLGTEDMKGGIACILQAGEYAAKHNIPLKIIFGVDEENISQGAHDLVDSGLLSDVFFLIVAESGQIVNIKQPFNVCYGRNGRCLYEMTVFGKKAHAAESKKGINAIEKAAEIIAFIQQMKFVSHERLGRTQIIFHTIKSATDSFSLPDKCLLQFSTLTTPNIKREEIEDRIKSYADKIGCSIILNQKKRKTPYGQSYEVRKNEPFLQLLERELFKPSHVEPIYTQSVADENIFANRLKIPVISIGPIGGGGHTKDEWLDITSLKKTEKTYKKILDLYSSFRNK